MNNAMTDAGPERAGGDGAGDVGDTGDAGYELSVVVPALNEADNVGPLVAEVESAVRGAGVSVELVVVDDGSTDGTADRLAELAATRPWLVVLRRDPNRWARAPR